MQLQRYIERLDTLALCIEQHVDMVRVPILKCQFYERGIIFILNLLTILLLGSYRRVMVILQTVLIKGILFEVDEISDSLTVLNIFIQIQSYSLSETIYISLSLPHI